MATEDVLAELQRVGILTQMEAVRAAAARRDNTAGSDLVHALASVGLTSFQVDAAVRGHVDQLVMGPYHLLSRIAEGGMGTVYQARHSRLGRVVALKVIRSDKLKSKVVSRRFVREIRLTANLEHPHVVRAYDAGVIDDKIYLATEYVAGLDLASHVRKKGPMPWREACRAIEHAALALQHIHERGMVHRDIKPSNLIRADATGDVKLLDLGLCSLPHDGACFDSQSGTITRNGVLLGTPDYISPEQARDPHGADIRADLYSLGCTFYYVLTGRPPFLGGAPVDKLMRHLFEAPPELSQESPVAVARIVARLMAKEPRDRYPTPMALVEALRGIDEDCEQEVTDENPFAEMYLESHVPETVTDGTCDMAPQRDWLWLIGAAFTVIISMALIARNLR